MAKEVAAFIKLQIKGVQPIPLLQLGLALGSKGVNIMEFCKQFNARTQNKAGKVLPVIITVYGDKSLTCCQRTTCSSTTERTFKNPERICRA